MTINGNQSRKGGRRPGAGRPFGSKNKVTQSIREKFEEAFNTLQESDETSLVAWAGENRTEFYKLAAKLIPSQVQHEGAVALHVLSGVPDADDASDLV